MTLKSLPLLAGLVLAGVASAGAPDANHVAKNAKWVVHVDFDRFRNTQVAEAVFEHVVDDRAAARIEAFKNLFQLDPRTDFHAMTAYGVDKEEDHAVLILYSDYDEDALLALLRSGDQYQHASYKGVDLHRFENENARADGQRVGKLGWVCFPAGDTMVFGHELARLHAAIDVIQDRSPDLAAGGDSSLWKMVPEKSAFFAAAADLDGLGDQLNQHAAILRQTDAIALVLDENDGTFSAALLVNAASDQAALQVSQILTGFVAMANLSVEEDPDKAWIADLTRNLRVDQVGRKVQVSVSCPAADVAGVVRRETAAKQAVQ